MRLFAFAVSFTIGVIGAVSCTPVKKCTPANCTGCCTTADVCDTGGNTAMACGKGGALCDRCVGAQLCAAGECQGGTGVGGGSGGGASGGGSAGGGSSGTEFTGTYQELWGWDGDGGRTATLTNFDRANVGVWYRDGGAFDYKRGFGNADGTFAVREVPDGEITLRLDKRYFVTTLRRVSFDTFNGGRRDAPQATSETLLRLTMRGLEPINADTNRAGVFFSQSSGAVTNLENVARPVTPAGSTSIESDLDWVAVSSGLGYGLPDSTKGDLGFALQYRTTVTDAGSNTTLVRSAAFGAVTLANGGTADAIADLTAPTTTALTLGFDKAAFTALRGSFGRDTTAGDFGVQVATSPSPAPHRYVGQGAISIASALSVETAPTPTLDVPAAFPASWGRTVFAYYIVDQRRSPTDGGTPTVFNGGVTMTDAPETFTGSVTPRLTPVRGAQIEGRNFIEDQSGITTTPTLAWMAPTMGTVSSYRVSINRLDTSGDVAELWRIYTPNIGVTLPPGILVAGNAYVFELEALSFGQGGISFTLPYASSSVISGVFRP
ncbi:MAG: hypothetical protein Q8L14_04370 [Myxococcales bacterium]|nr:hypothetical protein [Myxococcales bacterium]